MRTKQRHSCPCRYCGKKFTRRGMTKHVNKCPERPAAPLGTTGALPIEIDILQHLIKEKEKAVIAHAWMTYDKLVGDRIFAFDEETTEREYEEANTALNNFIAGLTHPIDATQS